MYKRPAIRKSAGPANPPPAAVPSYLEQALAQPPEKKGITKENIEKLKPVFLKAIERRRARKPARAYKLSNLTSSLYNATALIENPDILKIFKRIENHKDSRITVASLKGGRFQELARINEKSHIPLKKGNPNQIGLGFTIDSKNNYVNIFSSGVVRFTGSSDAHKVISFIEEYTGTLEYIEYSNRSGQLLVNRTIDLKKFSDYLEKHKQTVIYDPRGHQLTVQLKFTENVKVPIEHQRGKQVEKSVVRLEQEYETVEETKKIFTMTFFNTGVIQYKGRITADEGQIISFIKAALDDAQAAGAFTGQSAQREKKETKVLTYKTRSSNPPNPPDSFEGKCPEGQYCRPNAQGFPTCYKIPVINESSRKTVIDSYKGRPIPASVKAIFGIKESAGETKVAIKFEKQDYLGRKVDVLKIGSRQCARMTEDELIEVARQHGIPGIKKGMGITKMCQRIGESIEKPLVTKSNFQIDGDDFFINGEHIRGAKRSNKKPNPGRKCVTLPVETLQKYARAMGIDPGRKTKAEICKAMQEKKLAAHSVVVEQPAPPEKNFKSLFRDDERNQMTKIKHYSKEWLGKDIEALDDDQIRAILHTNKSNRSVFLAQEYESSRRLKKAVEKIKKRKIDVLLDELGLSGSMRRYVEEYATEKKATMAQVKEYAKRLLSIRARLDRESTERVEGTGHVDEIM